MPTVLAAPDKFRGTATAAQVAAAIADAAHDAGWDVQRVPVSDGGEGLLECFGGPNRTSVVHGPLHEPVPAGWRLDGARAVIEMAQASGRSALTGANDPVAADTAGTGELIALALDAGAREIVVGVGGSAGTDGGRAALDVLLERRADLRDVTLVVACDVRTPFVEAAEVFGPQKGATPDQVRELTARLERLADDYAVQFGVDVRELPGAGAAGGLAGGLAVLGATLRPGFDVVAEHLHLAGRVSGVDLVVTGEGRLDATSLQGKVTGSLAGLCARAGTPVLIVAGSTADGARPTGAQVVDLSARYGADAARRDVCGRVRDAVATALRDAHS